MKKKPLRILAGMALYVLSASVAQAIPWTLLNVTFDDGGTARGSFDYDASAGTLSSITIITTAGSILGGMRTYPLEHPTARRSNSAITLIDAITSDLTDQMALLLSLAAPLTDAGGTVSLTGLGEGDCTEPTCTRVSPIREISSGSITSSGPRPAAPAQQPTPETPRPSTKSSVPESAEIAALTPTASVPEPATLALLGIGLAGLGFTRGRTKR